MSMIFDMNDKMNDLRAKAERMIQAVQMTNALLGGIAQDNVMDDAAEIARAYLALLDDSKRLDALESKGVQSVHLNDGDQINPASMMFRAAVDSWMAGRGIR
jgi:hypothetical protein